MHEGHILGHNLRRVVRLEIRVQAAEQDLLEGGQKRHYVMLLLINTSNTSTRTPSTDAAVEGVRVEVLQRGKLHVDMTFALPPLLHSRHEVYGHFDGFLATLRTHTEGVLICSYPSLYVGYWGQYRIPHAVVGCLQGVTRRMRQTVWALTLLAALNTFHLGQRRFCFHLAGKSALNRLKPAGRDI